MNYAPFDSRWEFLHYYKDVCSITGSNLSEYGIWLKEKGTNSFRIVTEIKDEGVVIGINKLRICGITVVNDMTSWYELYENYVFLDDSPCGKKLQG